MDDAGVPCCTRHAVLSEEIDQLFDVGWSLMFIGDDERAYVPNEMSSRTSLHRNDVLYHGRWVWLPIEERKLEYKPGYSGFL